MRWLTIMMVLSSMAVLGIGIFNGTKSAVIEEPQMQVPDNGDFSKFKHDSSYHARLPCLLCHRRETNSATPGWPGKTNHLPCAGCHAKQFADTGSPICTVCHTNAQSGGLKPFPRLTSFAMKFDHARHVGMRSVACVSCHKPQRQGVAMTIPSGFNAHVTCFQCHGPGAKSGDRDISSCGTCHALGHPSRTREAAAAFQVGFSHSKHGKAEGLACNECHRVRAGVSRNQVSAPQPLNHHASTNALSCMSCHNGKRAFGGDDFSACKRCHQGTTWHF
ncbi:MAG TPA: cytochrome c3 family protein [Pyrinomonadaceae bacterium]|nr:cytochrome c3 family protein [Pyrinomonadaceae bacterium]